MCPQIDSPAPAAGKHDHEREEGPVKAVTLVGVVLITPSAS
jgi:hypothetical protein